MIKISGRIVLLLLSFSFLFALSDSIIAQSRHMSAQSLGLGGGGTAYQDLYHANFINPANLMLNSESRPKITIGLVGGVSSRAGGSLVNISVYNDYLTSGRTINSGTADEMLDKWFGTNDNNLRSVQADLSVIPLGFVYRSENWTVSAVSRVRALGNSGYSRGFADLFFNGLNAELFSDGRAIDTEQNVYLFNEISAGFATTVWEKNQLFGFGSNVKLHVGAAPKVLISNHYFSASLVSDLQIQEATGNTPSEIRHSFSYKAEAIGELSGQLAEFRRDQQAGTDPALGDYVDLDSGDFSGISGVSLGIDFGATLEMNIDDISFFNRRFFDGEKKLRVGLSVTDLGSLNFNDQPRTFSATDDFIWQGFNYDSDVIEEEFDGDEDKYFESVLTDSIGNDIYANFRVDESSGFRKSLPSMINFGSQIMLGKFSMMMDLGAGFNTAGTNSKKLSFALGSEYRFFDIWPVRLGLRTGGYSSTAYHIGTGIELRNFEFSLGAATTSNTASRGNSLGFAWSGFVAHF